MPTADGSRCCARGRPPASSRGAFELCQGRAVAAPPRFRSRLVARTAAGHPLYPTVHALGPLKDAIPVSDPTARQLLQLYTERISPQLITTQLSRPDPFVHDVLPCDGRRAGPWWYIHLGLGRCQQRTHQDLVLLWSGYPGIEIHPVRLVHQLTPRRPETLFGHCSPMPV